MLKFIILGLFVTVLLVRNSESAPKYQVLEKKDGYIPVYIRVGDQPLANINPELAEAFHEASISARNIRDEMALMADQPAQSSESASSEEKEKDKKKKNIKKKASSESNESSSSEEIVRITDEHQHQHNHQDQKPIPI